MRIICAKSKEQVGLLSASIIKNLVLEKPDCVLGLATGSTPINTYKYLVKSYQDGEISFKDVTTVNLDEYEGLASDHVQSYRYFMQDNLFDHIDIQAENTHVPDGLCEDVEKHLTEYEELISKLGVDLQLLGLGHDGHIGFNEPCDHFPLATHRVHLNEITLEANKRFFNSLEEVPTYAYTQGIGTIMKAKKILLIVTGADKKEILEKSLKGPITPTVPASILQLHPNVIVIADETAYPF